MDISPLSSSFLSAGFINPETIQDNEEEVMVDIAETFGSLSIDMCHNSFPLDLEDHKNKMESPSIFSVQV